MAAPFSLRNLAGVLRTFRQGRTPGQLIVQLTDACNASCPQCGMRRNAPFRRSLLLLDRCRSIIDHAADSGIQALSITGGEPLLYRTELLTLLNHATSRNIPYLRTGTNGFLFMDHEHPDYADRISRLAEELAKTSLNSFWISLDAPHAETHEAMRGLPGVTKGIEKALPIFHDHGIYPSANLGITRAILTTPEPTAGPVAATEEAFLAGFSAFFRRVIDMGFTIVNACYPMSGGGESDPALSAIYAATATDNLVTFSNSEKVSLFRALGETIPRFRPHIRIFSPRCALYALEQQHAGSNNLTTARPCRGGSDFFFIDAATGLTYPCGYRGTEPLGLFEELDLRQPPLPANCTACDWECFRDPTELFGPFCEAATRPISLLKTLLRHGKQTRHWLTDLAYFRACNYFNGRTAPDFNALSRFLPPDEQDSPSRSKSPH